MVKRKVTEDAQLPKIPKTKKKKVSVSSCEKTGKINLENPTKVIESLLGDIKVKDFFDKYWEKDPLVCHRKDADFYGNLFSLSTMKEVLENNELLYHADFNVCRYKDGEKELLNGDGRITVKDVEKLMSKDNATIQFYHPQRYVDDFWSMLEKLETHFGCLVDSHVYVTPAKAQGLPPHCDDVESFVLQLEGKSEWKLYKPQVELTRDFTQDLHEENIGEPTMTEILEPGDMLYFSRGVIYQSKTVGDDHSTHITISTYQENTWGDFMNHAVTQAVENALEHDVTIRTGLPVDYLSMMGTGKNLSQYIEEEDEEKKKKKNKYSNLQDVKVKKFKEDLEKRISKLVDHIDVNTATDAMCTHFMANRLPPFGYEVKNEEDSEEKITPEVKINDQIKIKYPEHVRIVYAEEDDDSDDENEDGASEEEEEEEMEEDEEEKPAKSKGNKSKKTSTKNEKKKGKSPAKKGDEEEDIGDEDIGDEDDDDEEDAEIPDDEPHIKVVHSLDNNRFAHMGPESFDDPGYIKLDLNFAKAMVDLLNEEDFVTVKDINMEDKDDKILLTTTLLESDLVEIKSK